MTDDQRALQASIRAELGITDHFDVQQEIERRVRFLSDYLLRTGCRSLLR
ncbi:NAD(+) synthase, partial [Alcaligenes faecalis]|nr:NAD(+) synthase [Alcaligenes faecalis]